MIGLLAIRTGAATAGRVGVGIGLAMIRCSTDEGSTNAVGSGAGGEALLPEEAIASRHSPATEARRNRVGAGVGRIRTPAR